MLSIFCAAATDAAYAEALGIGVPDGFVPTAVALNCGAYKLVVREKTGDPMLDLNGDLMADLLPGGGTEEEYALISPIDYVGPSFPPAFVMTAEADFLRSDALPLVHRLEEAGVEVCYHLYVSPERELSHVFHCDMRLAEASQCNADECAFFFAHVR